MIRPLSSEFSILLSDVKSQLAGHAKTSHGPRVGADMMDDAPDSRTRISIHGPRVGADFSHFTGNQMINISIHGPCVGADSEMRRARIPTM